MTILTFKKYEFINKSTIILYKICHTNVVILKNGEIFEILAAERVGVVN